MELEGDPHLDDVSLSGDKWVELHKELEQQQNAGKQVQQAWDHINKLIQAKSLAEIVLETDRIRRLAEKLKTDGLINAFNKEWQR